MQRAAAFKAAVANYWAKAHSFFTSAIGKAVMALLVVGVVAGYAHHRGASGKAELAAQVEQLKQQLAEAKAQPAPKQETPYWQCNGPKDTRHPQCPDESADELQSRLAESEKAKATLQQKVKDYEKQLAKHRGKGGSFVLSPADARGLSNIK